MNAILAAKNGGGGGKNPPKKKSLSYDQINRWSDYVEANPSRDLNALYKGYSANNPDAPIDYESLQSDLSELRNRTAMLAKRTVQDGGVGNSYLNTGYSFPKTRVDGKDYGRVNAMMQTQTAPPSINNIPESSLAKKLPYGVEEAWFDDKDGVVKFIDPQSGDVRMASRDLLYHPLVRKSLQKQQDDAAMRQEQIALK